MENQSHAFKPQTIIPPPKLPKHWSQLGFVIIKEESGCKTVQEPGSKQRENVPALLQEGFPTPSWP